MIDRPLSIFIASASEGLSVPEPRVSREHAQFVRELDGIYLVDQGGEHATYVNGERVVRCKLTPNDRAEFGIRDATYVIFNPDRPPASAAQELLIQVASWRPTTGGGSDVDMLNTFLKAARKLNAFRRSRGGSTCTVRSCFKADSR
jgi:pSer/pThr/pTyr-binding forkhead associated (FHA) protein